MQIYAYDAQRALVHILQADRRVAYTCPECQEALRPRRGDFRKAHFYHAASADCSHHSGKSLTHLNIQYALQKMLAPEETTLECRYPEIGRIADLAWPAKKLIFEIQVSPISAAQVRQRNHDYHTIGYRVIWILHDRRFNRFRLTPAELELQHVPHYFTNINAFGKGIFYDQYAAIRFKRRIKRSKRFPVQFKNMILFHFKQTTSQLYPNNRFARKQWGISFEGDIANKGWIEIKAEKILLSEPLAFCKHILYQFSHIYTFILNFLLEKTTD